MSVYAHDVSNLSNDKRKRCANCLLIGVGVIHDDHVFFLGNIVDQDPILLGLPHHDFTTQFPTTLLISDCNGFGHWVDIEQVNHHFIALIEEQLEPLIIAYLANIPLASAVTIAPHTLTCAKEPFVHNDHVKVKVIVVGGETDQVKSI